MQSIRDLVVGGGGFYILLYLSPFCCLQHTNLREVGFTCRSHAATGEKQKKSDLVDKANN